MGKQEVFILGREGDNLSRQPEKATWGPGGKKRGTNMDSGMPKPVLYNHNYPDSSNSKALKLPH